MKLQDTPIYLFRFDSQGMVGSAELINVDQFSTIVEHAIREKETLTVSDSAKDGNCLCRIERGRVEWPRLDAIFPKKDLDGYGVDLSGLFP